MKTQENKILGYFVLNENTLGYLFPWLEGFGLGILGSKITEGGRDWKNSPLLIQKNELIQLRKATQEDFDYFNVSSRGHISQEN